MKATTFNILTGALVGAAVVAAGFVGWPTVEASVHELTRPVAVPTSTRVYSDCTITEAAKPFWVNASANEIPRALVLTCDGDSITVKGDFTPKTSNNYDAADTNIRSAIMVEDTNGMEARIWHRRPMAGYLADCLTIQAVDSSVPSRDECK